MTLSQPPGSTLCWGSSGLFSRSGKTECKLWDQEGGEGRRRTVKHSLQNLTAYSFQEKSPVATRSPGRRTEPSLSLKRALTSCPSQIPLQVCLAHACEVLYSAVSTNFAPFCWQNLRSACMGPILQHSNTSRLLTSI